MCKKLIILNQNNDLAAFIYIQLLNAMNGYQLSRAWFDWAFENPEKIKPNHAALYFYCIEACNRLGWKEKFGLPTSIAKDAIGIKSYNTYINTLRDLEEWGFIKMIEWSKNQHSSNIIALSISDKATSKALDKAMITHSTKLGESTGESTSSIIKQENPEQLNQEQGNHFSETEKSLSKESQESVERSLKDISTVAEISVSTSFPDERLKSSLLNFFEHLNDKGEKITRVRVRAAIEKALSVDTEDAIDSINTAISGNHSTFITRKSTTKGTPVKEETERIDTREVDYSEGL